jgi:hypothetical protein
VRHALIIPTYGFITPDITLSGRRGTKARVKVAGDLINYEIVKKDCIVPFPQNALPQGRELELIGPVPLGKNVGEYVRTLPEFADATILDDAPVSNGTFEDTIKSLNNIYFEIRDLFEADDTPTEPVHVHFVTDWSQLGRLWIIWHIAYRPQVRKLGWKASFHRVPNFRSWKEIWVHEILKAYPKCILQSLHWRFFVK